MPRPSTTPSCEPTPVLSASTRRTISAVLGEAARLPPLVATSVPLRRGTAQTSQGDVAQAHQGGKAPGNSQRDFAARFAPANRVIPEHFLHPARWGQRPRPVRGG